MSQINKAKVNTDSNWSLATKYMSFVGFVLFVTANTCTCSSSSSTASAFCVSPLLPTGGDVCVGGVWLWWVNTGEASRRFA
jgi:hypothetical protein